MSAPRQQKDEPKVIDHFAYAERALAQADAHANMDGNIPNRKELVDRELAFAQVHATLAFVQAMNERA